MIRSVPSHELAPSRQTLRPAEGVCWLFILAIQALPPLIRIRLAPTRAGYLITDLTELSSAPETSDNLHFGTLAQRPCPDLVEICSKRWDTLMLNKRDMFAALLQFKVVVHGQNQPSHHSNLNRSKPCPAIALSHGHFRSTVPFGVALYRQQIVCKVTTKSCRAKSLSE